MQITLENVGKHYNYQWVFRDLNYTFQSGQQYAVLGPNGSGKSTLLRILSGQLLASKGQVTYLHQQHPLDPDNWYRYISLAAPYLELVEELTLEELLHFHSRLKPFLDGAPPSQILKKMELAHVRQRLVGHLSSGMMQRVKLGLAMWSDVPVVLLDEPFTNLDKNGIRWCRHVMEDTLQNRLVIICSNRENEYATCDAMVNLGDEKHKPEHFS